MRLMPVELLRQSPSRNSRLESVQGDANVRAQVGAVNCENIIETKILWKKVPILGEGAGGLKAATGGPCVRSCSVIAQTFGSFTPD
jgi:hypothetical protein